MVVAVLGVVGSRHLTAGAPTDLLTVVTVRRRLKVLVTGDGRRHWRVTIPQREEQFF
jgi:hypothetical protein